MCRGLPWSTGINRDVPGRDSEILNMFKITGLCRGPPRWSSLSGSAVQAPCWRRDLPCLRRGVPYWRRDVLYLYLCHYTISVGMYHVGYGLGHGLGRDNHLLARHLLFFSSFRRFLWIFVDVDASAIKLIMIWNRKVFLIGIRISPGSTGVYRVNAGVCRVHAGVMVLEAIVDAIFFPISSR